MIILDTHIWIWWIDENPKMSAKNREIIQANQTSGLGISIISCWEIAKLVEKNKLILECSVEEWLELALKHPGIQLLELSLPIDYLRINSIIWLSCRSRRPNYCGNG